ncbi:hypothetical protein LSS_17225 [Leptospira santarosai serovar Shermani str. LT 821]|uniref:Uncharacterized protein n=1 Tax=Leptospira santarosai serovar Shermani str. LT 821 TaxID=758847 RepID=K8Y4B7_9LEPT|nr:hypothetical protein LSS_17225 [Leptospira santarosai serovar Shermani str. LT 821]
MRKFKSSRRYFLDFMEVFKKSIQSNSKKILVVGNL